MNPIIRLLITVDFFVLSGWGLVSPIFAIFVERNIAGGSIAAAGFAQTIYMVVKSLLQLAVGKYNDRDSGYVHEFWTSLIGYAILMAIPICYLQINTITQLYIVQALFGVGAAFAYPGFMTIFTKFADPQHEGMEWSMYSTSVFLGMAIAAAVGAWAVEQWGFAPVFMGVAFLGLVGCIAFASLVRRYAELRQDHRPQRRHPRDVLSVR